MDIICLVDLIPTACGHDRGVLSHSKLWQLLNEGQLNKRVGDMRYYFRDWCFCLQTDVV